jgi:hypothetical protein
VTANTYFVQNSCGNRLKGTDKPVNIAPGTVGTGIPATVTGFPALGTALGAGDAAASDLQLISRYDGRAYSAWSMGAGSKLGTRRGSDGDNELARPRDQRFQILALNG